MRRSSLFLTVAAGLIASLAFVSSSRADSIVTYHADFGVTGGTASDIELLFTTGATATIANPMGIGTPTVAYPSSGLVEVNFGAPSSSGSVDITVDVTGTGFLEAYFLTGLTQGVSSSFLNVATVPEPTSMALLGIGMASFLAYRRFTKRSATV